MGNKSVKDCCRLCGFVFLDKKRKRNITGDFAKIFESVCSQKAANSDLPGAVCGTCRNTEWKENGENPPSQKIWNENILFSPWLQVKETNKRFIEQNIRIQHSALQSPGHRHFCLYADVIKHGVWVQFPKTYSGLKFCPAFFVRYWCPLSPSYYERGPK